MKNLVLLLLLFINLGILFSQSKKQQIENLTFKVDSLNSLLVNEKAINAYYLDSMIQLNFSIRSAELNKKELQKKLFELNNQLEEKMEQIKTSQLAFKTKQDQVEILNFQNKLQESTIDSITNLLKSTNYFLEDEASVSSFVKFLSEEQGIEIPSSNQVKIIKISPNVKYFEFDFSNLDIELLMEKYNIEHHSDIISQIFCDSSNSLSYLTWQLTCCPGHNEEALIFPLGDEFISFKHFFGTTGGELKIFKNKNRVANFDYNIDSEIGEEGSFFLNLNE